MLNYIKSEFYRVFYGREIYCISAAFAFLAFLMNLIIYLFDRFTPDFPYGSIWFSLNILTGSMGILFIGGLVVTSYLFSDEHKNGTLKNTVSYGISRGQFFTGKCIICSIASLFSMAIILTVFYGSAYLLLDGQRDVTILERLKGVAVNLPAAFSAVILAAALMCLLKKEGTVIMWWMGIMWGIPMFSFFMGLKIEWLGKAAEWMPWNYLKYEVSVNMSQYKCLWDTPEGFAKCLIAGSIGIVVFYIVGLICFRKKEIA